MFGKNQTKTTYLILCLVIIAGAAALWYIQTQPEKANTNTAPTAPKNDITVKSTPPSGPLPLLPADFPFDNSGTIAQNYTATSATEGTQYTRTYTTKKTVLAVYNSYVSYLNQNGWTLLIKQQVAQTGTIFGYRGKVGVTISIQDLKDSRFVSITVGEANTPFLTPDQIKASEPPTIKPPVPR